MKHTLSPHFEEVVLSSTGASGMEVVEAIQELWSGYGEIVRVRLKNGKSDREAKYPCAEHGQTGNMKCPPSVVVKHVRMPGSDGGSHPRGWNSDLSHARKVRSYQVEMNWYRDWSGRCDAGCRVPRCLAFAEEGDDVLLVMEDLDAAGYPGRLRKVEWAQVEGCLGWLANFHATFMGEKPDGLWETGTYWHLATRIEELEVLAGEDRVLMDAAVAIDRKLSGARFQSLVHGDAKLANFCFSEPGGGEVAAVDFQYVGGGCGMKDVAYFIGSCLDEAECEEMEGVVLDYYFAELRKALVSGAEGTGGVVDVEAIESEWRALYPVAWTDFHRFLKGWSPGHWKINSYSERMAQEVVGKVGNEKAES